MVLMSPTDDSGVDARTGFNCGTYDEDGENTSENEEDSSEKDSLYKSGLIAGAIKPCY